MNNVNHLFLKQEAPAPGFERGVEDAFVVLVVVDGIVGYGIAVVLSRRESLSSRIGQSTMGSTVEWPYSLSSSESWNSLAVSRPAVEWASTP